MGRKIKFYFGIQLSLFRDRQGLKLGFKFRLFSISYERLKILHRDPAWDEGNPELTPKMADPSLLTELPITRMIEPEDIIKGSFEEPKLIEPEDM